MTTVLPIEDDPAILRGLADDLRFEGYAVLTASDFYQQPALAFCEAQGIQVLKDLERVRLIRGRKE